MNPPRGVTAAGGTATVEAQPVHLGGEALVQLLDQTPQGTGSLGPDPRYGQLTGGYDKVPAPRVFVAEVTSSSTTPTGCSNFPTQDWNETVVKFGKFTARIDIKALLRGTYYIFEIPVEGQPLPKIVAVMPVQASFVTMFQLLSDLNGYKRWAPDMVYSEGEDRDDFSLHAWQTNMSVLGGKFGGFEAISTDTKLVNADGNFASFDFVIKKGAVVNNPADDGTVLRLPMERNDGFTRIAACRDGSDGQPPITLVAYEISAIPNLEVIGRKMIGVKDAVVYTAVETAKDIVNVLPGIDIKEGELKDTSAAEARKVGFSTLQTAEAGVAMFSGQTMDKMVRNLATLAGHMERNEDWSQHTKGATWTPYAESLTRVDLE